MEEKLGDFAVAPGEGAWIEIHTMNYQKFYKAVAPGEGAWIEITSSLKSTSMLRPSLPVRERGLKSF